MEDEYWKKRYEKLLDKVTYFHHTWSRDEWIMAIEEEIETEEIKHEGTVEDAKVRKVTRHDTS